jgi:hypothetical protein
LWTLAAISAGLVAFAIGTLWLAVAAWAFAGAAVAWRRIEAVRAGRLADALRAALETGGEREAVLQHVAGLVAYSSALSWAGVLAWRASELDGRLESQWGGPDEAPAETALTSWLLREAETTETVVIASAEELGRSGSCLALSLRSGESVSGYALFLFARPIPGHVELALRRCGPDLAEHLATSGTELPKRRLEAVS